MADYFSEATRPFFSICIPAYNASRYLAACLESIEMQSFADWEVIIVDDASSDDTLAIAEDRSAMDPSRISVVGLKKNGGPYHARRIAIASSHGQYLLFIDSDDELVGSDALATIAKCLNDSGADILAFNMTDDMSNPHGLIPYSKFFNLSVADSVTCIGGRDFLMSFLRTYELNNLAGKAIRRDLVTMPLVDSSVRLLVAEDRLEVFNALSKAHSVLIFDESFYYYRPNEFSTTHGELTMAYCQQQAFVEQHIYKILNKMGLDSTGLLSNYIGILTYEIRKLCADCSGCEAHERISKLAKTNFCGNACKQWLGLHIANRAGGIDVWLRAKLFANGWYWLEVFFCWMLNRIAGSRPKKRNECQFDE